MQKNRLPMFGYFGSGFLRAQGQGVIDVLADVEKMSETIVKIGGVAQWYGIILLKTLRYSWQLASTPLFAKVLVEFSSRPVLE